VFEFLAGIDRRYSMVILDPPAFAKSRKASRMRRAVTRRSTCARLRLLEPGGVLVTCSCSHHFGEAELMQVVAEAALDAGKTLRVLERRTQASDHPILLTVPETLYLKCLILEVVGH
jgi:23S rRNA (cytosine1962-C5)-methyltransferase